MGGCKRERKRAPAPESASYAGREIELPEIDKTAGVTQRSFQEETNDHGSEIMFTESRNPRRVNERRLQEEANDDSLGIEGLC